MTRQNRSFGLRLFAGFFAPLFFVACAGGIGGENGFDASGKPQFSDPEHTYTPPPLRLCEYVGTNQQAYDEGTGRFALVDMTNAAQGYIATQCTTTGQRAVLQMSNGDQQNTYVIDNTGLTEFYPLSMGNGYYTFAILFQADGTQYEQFMVAQGDVQLESDKAPFLVPSKIVNYDASSEAVKLSYQLAEHASSDVEVVQQVYYWIANNITYDTAKAESLKDSSDYTPSPDRLLRDKTGICYDYASLVAAMLRANGIPCKLIKGMVNTSNGQIYHAWNMIWLEGQGWVTVKVPTTPEEWQRIDLTFASAGASAEEFIGDGTNYMETSEH